jgi:hypothetical protein
MPLIIHYGTVVDGVIDVEHCFCRPAKMYTEEIQDDDGTDITVTYYALPNGRDESEFTVTELSQAEAETLAARLCQTAHNIQGGEWDWKVE